MPREQVNFGAHKAAPRDCHRRGHGPTGGDQLSGEKHTPERPRHHAPWQDRFWRFVTPTDPSECWEWQGYRMTSGYGLLSRGAWGASSIMAHRASYELHHGEIPEGLVIDHMCVNPPCVNPAHLQVVTPAENSRLMAARWPAPTHCRMGHPFDEANLYVSPRGHRRCRACQRDKYHAKKDLERITRPDEEPS